MDIKDIAGLSEPLKRVIDCLDKGVSSLFSPFIYKKVERAKMQIEQEKSDKNALIALKDAMTEDLIRVARTSRDRNELHNIAEIYGGAIVELQNFDPSKLPALLPSNEWAAHFYDSAKDCSDDEIRILWSKILAGEIKEPGKYFKRTLTNLKQIEKHEAEWFGKFCKYTIDNSFFPEFALEGNRYLHFNEFQSLVDCGFINANLGGFLLDESAELSFGSVVIEVTVGEKPYNLGIYTLTDTGTQICSLLKSEPDEKFIEDFSAELRKHKGIQTPIVGIR